MKIIKLISIMLLSILFFTGCMPPHQITFDKSIKKDYINHTNEVYKKMKKCYQTFPIENIFGIYPIKEIYKNPNYSKIILYAKFANNNADDVIGIITIFEKKDNLHRVVITERIERLSKWYYLNNMECHND